MNTRIAFNPALFVALILVLVPGCKSENKAPEAPKTKQSQAKAVKATSVTPPEAASKLITTKKADPSRMPRDRIHAPFHKSAGGAHPGAMGASRGSKPETKTDGHSKMPLPVKGAGGAEELSRRLALVSDAKLKAPSYSSSEVLDSYAPL